MGTTIGAAGPERADTMAVIVPSIARPAVLDFLQNQVVDGVELCLQGLVWINAILIIQVVHQTEH
jgi:hypothetical protein